MKNPFSILFLVSALLLGFSTSSLRGQDANGIYSKVDESPIPVKTPPPKYPDALRRDGISGVVAVAVVIDETGGVIDATVSKSSHMAFERPSLDALKSWKFKPARVAGNAVKVRVTVPMRFNVQD